MFLLISLLLYSVLKVSFDILINLVGVDGNEDPPVPIPNTEVKLIHVEDTWLATARENR